MCVCVCVQANDENFSYLFLSYSPYTPNITAMRHMVSQNFLEGYSAYL